MTGTAIGRYRLLHQIGAGGMGEVYLAEDTELGRRAALKLLARSDEGNATSRRRFFREAKLAASINHPFVCKVYEAAEFDGRLFIAMEFINGRTLEAQLREGPLPLEQAMRLFIEIAEAIHCAHESGLIHRDLKPANIMLATDGHVRVLDFGIAKQLRWQNDETQTATESGTLAGTLAYMSPEQISGLPVDHRSDIYSMGLIFFGMLTGSHPFARKSALACAMAILNEEPAPLQRYTSGLPVELDATIGRMLAKPVIDRFQSVQEVLNALQAGFVAEPFSPRQPTQQVSASCSIAVMPFINISRDASQDFFSDGITEDLIRQVSQLQGTKVLARTSIMRYKNSDKPVSVIGNELGVTYILEGSVRQSGNKVRISSGLVAVATGTYVWSEIYDRDLTDILAIQSDVARQIANSLQMTLPETSRFKRDAAPNVEAYRSFLKGMYLLNQLAPDSVEKSIRFFDEALAIAPDYARAYAGISYANCMLGHFDYLPSEQAFSRAKKAALKAFDLAPSLPETHICMGLTQMFYDWDWGAAENSFRQALKINSNSADGHLYYSWCLALMQDVSGAVIEARYALELDPLSPTAQTNLAQWLVNDGKFDESISILNKTLDLNPNYLYAYTLLGQNYAGLGDYDRAMSNFDRFAWRPTLKAIGMAAFGKHDDALAVAEAVQKGNLGPWRPSEIALLLVMAGKREEAEAWLDRALHQRDYMLGFLMACKWAPFQEEPLLIEHLEQMGITRRNLPNLTVVSP